MYKEIVERGERGKRGKVGELFVLTSSKLAVRWVGFIFSLGV